MLYPEIALVPEDEIPERTPLRPGARRARRMLAMGLGILALMVSSAVGSAYAVGGFTDVPSEHPFKGSIDWAALHGVASGYPDGTFKPGGSVNRGQMTQFFRNYNAGFTVHSNSGSAYGFDLTVTATCPAGKRPISGGSLKNGPDVYLANSYASGDGWTVSWETEGNVARSIVGAVFAVCMPDDSTT